MSCLWPFSTISTLKTHMTGFYTVPVYRSVSPRSKTSSICSSSGLAQLSCGHSFPYRAMPCSVSSWAIITGRRNSPKEGKANGGSQQLCLLQRCCTSLTTLRFMPTITYCTAQSHSCCSYGGSDCGKSAKPTNYRSAITISIRHIKSKSLPSGAFVFLLPRSGSGSILKALLFCPKPSPGM